MNRISSAYREAIGNIKAREISFDLVKHQFVGGSVDGSGETIVGFHHGLKIIKPSQKMIGMWTLAGTKGFFEEDDFSIMRFHKVEKMTKTHFILRDYPVALNDKGSLVPIKNSPGKTRRYLPCILSDEYPSIILNSRKGKCVTFSFDPIAVR